MSGRRVARSGGALSGKKRNPGPKQRSLPRLALSMSSDARPLRTRPRTRIPQHPAGERLLGSLGNEREPSITAAGAKDRIREIGNDRDGVDELRG